MIFSNNRLGKFIRNGRLDLNLTQEQLAEKLNCNLSYLGTVERGKNIPSLKLFCRIILILNLSADAFIRPKQNTENSTYLQLIRLLPQCTPKELKILLENARTLLENREEKPRNPLSTMILEPLCIFDYIFTRKGILVRYRDHFLKIWVV